MRAVVNESYELVAIGSLQPHPDNPRRGLVEPIRESIRTNGFYGAVVAQRSSGRILAGEHRWKAAAAEGAEQVPVIWADVDDVTARRILLADNRTNDLAGYDDAALAAILQAVAELPDGLVGTGWDDAALAELLAAQDDGPRVGLTDSDDVPEPPAEPVTRPGDLWHLGDHRLLCGDATSREDVAHLLVGQQIPLTFTSFPYAVGLDYGDTYEDTIENLRVLLRDVPPLLAEAATPGGYVLVNFGDTVAGRQIAEVDEPCEYPMALEHWPVFRAAGFVLHTRRVWAKPHARVSAPWTANSNRAAFDWEHLWAWKAPGQGLNERRDPSFLGVCDTSRLEGVEVGKAVHPAAFAMGFAELVLRVYSNAGDRVLDPFLGTGTTLVACHRQGRVGFGCEISPAYVDVACRRFQAHTGIVPVLESTGQPHDFTAEPSDAPS